MLYQLTTGNMDERRKVVMERKENIPTNESEIKFEKIDLTNLEEVEEVVTPGWGTHTCCY